MQARSAAAAVPALAAIDGASDQQQRTAGTTTLLPDLVLCRRGLEAHKGGGWLAGTARPACATGSTAAVVHAAGSGVPQSSRKARKRTQVTQSAQSSSEEAAAGELRVPPTMPHAQKVAPTRCTSVPPAQAAAVRPVPLAAPAPTRAEKAAPTRCPGTLAAARPDGTRTSRPGNRAAHGPPAAGRERVRMLRRRWCCTATVGTPTPRNVRAREVRGPRPLQRHCTTCTAKAPALGEAGKRRPVLRKATRRAVRCTRNQRTVWQGGHPARDWPQVSDPPLERELH